MKFIKVSLFAIGFTLITRWDQIYENWFSTENVSTHAGQIETGGRLANPPALPDLPTSTYWRKSIRPFMVEPSNRIGRLLEDKDIYTDDKMLKQSWWWESDKGFYYADEKRHGQGVLRLASGNVWKGPFVRGKKHGHWVVQFADGSMAEGQYLSGMKNGHWVYRWHNGDIWEGFFVDGAEHDQWIYQDADGSVKYETYRNGELVE